MIRRMNTEQLGGKRLRLLDELREHGGNGRSVYAERLHAEIAATRVELHRDPARQLGLVRDGAISSV